MANLLLIEKQPGGYFKFTLNGDSANAVTSIQNDLLAVGNQLHFKTGNGANIIKEQFIYPEDVTIIAGGTYTFTTVAQVWTKLIDIDYFAWLGTGSGGGIVDRFSELIDTFQYVGNAGKAVVVDNSELKLIPITLHNISTFTELTDTPDALVPNKMVVVNNAGNALILQDQPTPPEQFLNSVGYFDYNDLVTQTTPLTAVANVPLKLTNDTAGANTNTSQNPYGVSYVWDSTTNQFHFAELAIGDTIDIRVHVQVTTTSANQKISLKAKFGIGSAYQFENSIYSGQFKTAGLNEISFVAPFYIGSTLIRDYPAELTLITDAGATVKVDGWYVRILRKNINIITVDYTVPDATSSVKGVVRLGGDLSGTANTPTVPGLATKVPNTRSIGTTAPLLGGGTLNGDLTLSIPQANSIDSGYLSFGDWTHFNEAYNDKVVSIAVSGTTTKTLTITQQDGGTLTTSWTDDNSVTSVFGRTGAVVATIGDYTTSQVTEGTNLYYTNTRVSANTDVAANTIARHNAVTLGTANGLGLAGQVLSLGLATATLNGALSATDWATFNGKANDASVVHLAGTETITGAKTFENLVKLTGNGLSSGYAMEFDCATVDAIAVKQSGVQKLVVRTNGEILAQKYIIDGGFSTQFLKANGTLDSTVYQVALTNPITGTGTTNYIPKFTGTSTLGSSLLIYDNGTNVFVGGSGSNSNRFTVVEGGTTLVGQQILMQNASSANDALSIIHSGTGKLIKGTKGTEVFNISNTGGAYFADKVGIGTTSPAQKLHVAGISYFGSDIFTNQNGGIFFGGNNTYSCGIYGGNSGLDLQFNAGNTGEKMRITSAGNVGIGTTAPNRLLTVSGTQGLMSFNATSHRNTTIGSDLIGNFIVYDDTASAYRMVINSSGNVGIGTTSPSDIFHVNSPNEFGISWSRVLSGSQVGKRWALGIDSGGTYIFNRTDSTLPFYITNAGNVGIGTTSPNRALTIVGGNNEQIAISSTTTKCGIALNPSNTTYSPYIGSTGNDVIFETFGSERMRITSGGNVAIGTITNTYVSRLVLDGGASNNTLECVHTGTASTYNVIFSNANGAVGSIITNGSVTSYNMTSDYRLKEDFKEVTGLDKIDKIKIYNYKWKVSEDRMDGVIAHELKEVVPYAVTGEKDAEQMQSVDYSKLVPILVQSIKELNEKIKILENGKL